MSQEAQPLEAPTGTVMVILKPEVLDKTQFRRNSPEYALLVRLKDEPHQARFADEDGKRWCFIEGTPRILAQCFEIVEDRMYA